MSLEALAPDQRAVVQLVLQQERSYDDLAGLLGISADSVRDRARAGLDRVGGATGDVTAEERGEMVDYLLGQQSVSRREATRALLADSADARRWAREVSGALESVARSPLPGVPEDDAIDDDVDEAIGAGTAALPLGTSAPVADVPTEAAEAAEERREEREDVAEALGRRSPRPRPRPRPEGAHPAGRTGGDGPSGAGDDDRPRSSRLGGALLIGGVALFLVALVAFIIRNDDEKPATARNDATATATATPTVTPAVTIPLESTTGTKAQGAMAVFVSGQQIAFTIEAQGVVPNKQGEAYAVWLTGGGQPKRLGFAATVGDDGKFGVSGPREGDAQGFPERFVKATRVVVSRETSQDSTKPGPLILSGKIPQQGG